jgi:hypothetical protein
MRRIFLHDPGNDCSSSFAPSRSCTQAAVTTIRRFRGRHQRSAYALYSGFGSTARNSCPCTAADRNASILSSFLPPQGCRFDLTGFIGWNIRGWIAIEWRHFHEPDEHFVQLFGSSAEGGRIPAAPSPSTAYRGTATPRGLSLDALCAQTGTSFR